MNKMAKKRMARIMVGTLAGAGAVLFLSSQKGAGTRNQIRKMAVQTKDLGMELGHETAEKARDLIALGKEISHDEDWIEAIETLEIHPSTDKSSNSDERSHSEPHLKIVPPSEPKHDSDKA
ncbi:YtxH domain-containing protein [Saccharibacillus kuerlensis]|uniref:YtxH domain-containing protein n=1 Tax=Saccharibacillus kuerlensis TaxID=459527 RepID=A0ABQ2KXK5_9BACL|nr:YtxH domain-containing protein [Saccharibacillus kuerlensis]GGN95898.1 hypothetical protein GCM10010969_12230 [Saccharibacillus kuerlensis]